MTGASDVGSGDYGQYITDSKNKDEDDFDIDDSDYDVFIEEVGLSMTELFIKFIDALKSKMMRAR